MEYFSEPDSIDSEMADESNTIETTASSLKVGDLFTHDGEPWKVTSFEGQYLTADHATDPSIPYAIIALRETVKIERTSSDLSAAVALAVVVAVGVAVAVAARVLELEAQL